MQILVVGFHGMANEKCDCVEVGETSLFFNLSSASVQLIN